MRVRGPLARTVHSLPGGAHVQVTATPAPGVPGLFSRHELTVLADCSTLLVQDDDAHLGEPEPAWFDALADNWVNTAPGVVGIGAACPFDVPVTVDVRRALPADDSERELADHVTRAGLALPSGRLLVSVQDTRDTIPCIPLAPGSCAVRICSHGLNTLSGDALDGEDRYHVVLWPTDEDQPAQVLKRCPEPLPGGWAGSPGGSQAAARDNEIMAVCLSRAAVPLLPTKVNAPLGRKRWPAAAAPHLTALADRKSVV